MLAWCFSEMFSLYPPLHIRLAIVEHLLIEVCGATELRIPRIRAQNSRLYCHLDSTCGGGLRHVSLVAVYGLLSPLARPTEKRSCDVTDTEHLDKGHIRQILRRRHRRKRQPLFVYWQSATRRPLVMRRRPRMAHQIG